MTGDPEFSRANEGPDVEASPVTKVARDLTEILNLYDALLTQAVHHANATVDHSHMPGGRAMVELGNVANIEAWTNQQDTTERLGRAYTSAEDEDPDDSWPAFQLIEFWSEAWRAEHDAEYDRRPTIASEANFLRYSLNWAWDHEIHWDDFAADIRRARLRLEDIVYAGRRVERTRIICDRCEAEPRLIKVRTDDPTGDGDYYKCPACKVRFNQDEFEKAYAKMLKSTDAARYVRQADAIDLLRGQGWSERTIRRWIAAGDEDDSQVLDRYCDIATHAVWAWWPDLWRKHLTTRAARQSVA